MMADPVSSGGWNTTDDHEHTVPVKDANKVPVHSADDLQPKPNVFAASPAETNRLMMNLAAVCGVTVVVLLGAVFTFGIDSLRGNLTDSEPKTVVVTDDGNFDPAELVLYPGDLLVIENENENPQVLKSQDMAQELFATQVLFDRPFEFTVPAEAVGKDYTYYSETLSQDVLLRLYVRSAENQTSSSDDSSDEFDIPLPTGEMTMTSSSQEAVLPVVSSSSQPAVVLETTPPPPAESSASSSSVSSKPIGFGEFTTLAGEGGSTIIRVQAQNTINSSVPSFGKNAASLPTNPYTVANRLAAEQSGLIPAKTTKPSTTKTQTLHSGAPLVKPRANVQTGPTTQALMVVLATVGLFGFVYRKMNRNAHA